MALVTNPLASYKTQILETHLDTMGHVNNATYLTLFEQARWELIHQNGYGLERIHQEKKGPVILEVHLKFQRELKAREQIEIQTELIDYPGKVGHLKQVLYKEDGTVSAEAFFTFAFFDLEKRKLIEPNEAWKKALGI